MALTKTFIIGGTRSGKSDFALTKASEHQGMKAFVATAQARDSEMKERIDAHKCQRGSEWMTYEEPLKIAETLENIIPHYDVIVLDCLTLWLSNVMSTSEDPKAGIHVFTKTLRDIEISTHSVSLYLISNEVGMGIVPDNKLARIFRDLSGLMNKQVAGISDHVYLVSAGLPLKLK